MLADSFEQRAAELAKEKEVNIKQENEEAIKSMMGQLFFILYQH